MHNVRHALVTGGTGFVGGELVRQLIADGWRVTALHRAQSSGASLQAMGATPVAFVSASDAANVASSARPDALFHVATHQQKSWTADDLDTFIDANISLGTHLLKAVSATECVVVNAMSFFQYRHGQPVAHSLYSATKQAYAEVARYFREIEGLDIRDVVLFDNFGPRDPRPKLINSIVDSLRNGVPLALGPASQPINALHVSDVARGLIAASAPAGSSHLTVRAQEDTTVGHIVEELERIAGVGLNKTFADEQLPTTMVENAGDWPVPTGWHPLLSLSEGLRTMFEP